MLIDFFDRSGRHLVVVVDFDAAGILLDLERLFVFP
jgi:hypothetical protein